MTTPFQSPSSSSRQQGQGSVVREERRVLFQDANNNSRVGLQRKKTGPSSTASEAQSIQQSLQRTQNLLKNELDRVSQVATAIDEDGKLLDQTKDVHQSLGVKESQKALTSLQRAQQQEQRVLMASIAFFFTVVFYIMWQRILIKLPFVERIINSVWIWCHEVLGESVLNQIKMHLNSVMVWGEMVRKMALEKGQELMQLIQPQVELLREKGQELKHNIQPQVELAREKCQELIQYIQALIEGAKDQEL